MHWPLSQEINEAVQNPSSAFTDADLKTGRVGTSPMGVPLPRSGNYADVYQISCPNGPAWAAKCFTRPVPPDLQSRYEAIAAHLAEVRLPFTVGFEFQPEGLRVRGRSFPLVKMQWVEGFAVNEFIKNHLDRPAMLEGLLVLWVRLCRRLREARMAHGDLQHGNVILVPTPGRAAVELKLVDYDGMFVPALAGRPTGEAGHASYQHPRRVADNAYSIDLDRFPHLVVATALRGVLALGPTIWAKYDTGDNLLLTSRDFQQPAASALLRELWQQGDAACRTLAGHLALAASRPLPATPWLDDLIPEGCPEPLSPALEAEARQVLGLALMRPAGVPEPQSISPSLTPRTEAAAAWPKRFNSTTIFAAFLAALLAAVGLGYALGAFSSSAPSNGLPSGGSPLAVNPAGGTSSSAASISGTPTSGSPSNGASRDGTPAAGSSPLAVSPLAADPASDASRAVSPARGEPGSAPQAEQSVAGLTPLQAPPDPSGSSSAGAQQPSDGGPSGKVGEAAGGKVGEGASGKVGGGVIWSAQAPNGSNYMTVQYSHDGAILIATLEKTGVIHTFEAATGRRLAEFTGHEATERVLASPLPDGRVLSAGREPVLLVWNARTGVAEARVPRRPGPAPQALQTDRAGRYVLVAQQQQVEIIDLASLQEVLVLDLPHPAALGKAAAMLAASGDALLTITAENALRITALPPGSTKDVPLQLPQASRIMAWHPRAERAVLLSNDPPRASMVQHLVDTSTGRTLARIEGTRGRGAFTPDGTYYAAVTATPGHFDFFRAATGERVARVPLNGRHEAFDVAVSPDGSQAAFGGFNRVLLAVKVPVDQHQALVAAPRENQPRELAPPPNPARLTPPDQSAVAQAKQAVRARFETLFLREDPAARRRLAESLEQEALNASNPAATRWFANHQLLSLAETLHDCPLGERALDRLEAEFAVNLSGLRLRLYEAVGATVHRPDQVRAFAEAAGQFADQALTTDDFPTALKVIELARQAAGRIRLTTLARELDQRLSLLRQQESAFEQLGPMLTKLRHEPNDPEANLALGRFRCLEMQQWSAGLRHLAAGSDPELQRIAQAELRGGSAAAIADAWWTWAQEQPPTIRAVAEQRARVHYQTVLGRGTAEERARAADRLAFRMDGQEFRPGLIVEMIAPDLRQPYNSVRLMPRIDVKASDYRNLPGQQLGMKFSGLLVPPQPGNYTFKAVGRSRVFFHVFYRTPQDRRLFNVTLLDAPEEQRQGSVAFTRQPVPIYLEVLLSLRGIKSDPENSLSLRWVRPDGVEELVPPHVFFHAKAHESQLTEK